MAAGVLLVVAGVVSMIMSLYRQRIGTPAVQLVVGATLGTLVMLPALLQSASGTTVRAAIFVARRLRNYCGTFS